MPKYAQNASGYWETKVWDGSYKNGKKHYKTLRSNKSSRDLEKKVMDFEAARKTGLITVTSDITFYEYALKWLEISKATASLNTQMMYQGLIKKYLCDLDFFDLSRFNITVAQSVINQAKAHPRTCEQMKIMLKQILRYAEYDRLVPRGFANDVMNNVVLPKKKPTEKRPLTKEEIKAISETDFTPREKMFVYIIYGCGLRREEALALTKSDFSEAGISITKAVAFPTNAPHLKDTKSLQGYRTVPMPDFLKEYYPIYFDLIDSEELFPQMTKTVYVRMWEHIRSKMHSPTLTAHIFRHNYCTQLCYQAAMNHSISTKKIAQLLGDREQMVIQVYSHIIDEMEDTDTAISCAVKL